jgi:molecular chaperone HscB
MNYFELFNLPLAFNVDGEELSKQFELHKNSEAQAKKAYEVLSDPDLTVEYILKIKGLLPADEVYEPDPQFTLEVMDINEELTELEFDDQREQLMNVEQKTDRLLLKIIEDVTPVLDNYSEDTATEEALLQVKEYWYQKKYIQGILDRIRGVRNIASP